MRFYQIRNAETQESDYVTSKEDLEKGASLEDNTDISTSFTVVQEVDEKTFFAIVNPVVEENHIDQE